MRATTLADEIVRSVQSSPSETIVRPFEFGSTSVQNELLFFFKPECFLHSSSPQQIELISCALQLFERFNVQVRGCSVVPGPVLLERTIMDRHYGYINRLSRNAPSILGNAEVSAIREGVGAASDVPVVGGHEFLLNHPNLNETTLDALWASKPSKKLKSGLYFQLYTVDGEPVVLVNGFHPAQLAHFTRADRKIVLLVVASDFPWKTLRTVMLGDTFPDRAVRGSLRRMFFDDPERFGLRGVSIASNGSHLSAGPFEAMFEMWNFFSGSHLVGFDVEQTKMAKLLDSAGVDRAKRMQALQNPTISLNAERSLFDLTEELDSISSTHMFASLCATRA